MAPRLSSPPSGSREFPKGVLRKPGCGKIPPLQGRESAWYHS
jgi:hypothetical protein